MDDFNVGVVVTVGPGRRENVELMLQHLVRLVGKLPVCVVLILDGPEVETPVWPASPFPIHAVRLAERHRPGHEQPRNVGVRALQYDSAITHAWFLDSDILVGPDALRYYESANAMLETSAVLIGPYEWLPDHIREVAPEVYSDFRWPMFRERGFGPFVADLGVALGNFGGNLVWPVAEFTRIGGFHPQLHHGRCEDGELGLRAASHRIPMALVAEARGYHLSHDINHDLAEQRNRRDVPLINAWHPWVEGQGLLVTDEDGARFDFVCECGEQVNTLLMWDHMSSHVTRLESRQDELVLPEGM